MSNSTSTGNIETIRPTGSISLEQTKDEIRKVAPSWLEQRFSECPVIVALPKPEMIAWNTVFNWSSSDVAAERLLTLACEGRQHLGISQVDFVTSAYLNDAPHIDPEFAASMADQGWTQSQIDSLAQLTAKPDHIRNRMRGAAGSLISHPKYLQQLTVLKEAWSHLKPDSRPAFPLHRSIILPTTPPGFEQVVQSPEVNFQTAFNQFCDNWRLLGMLTWDLPHVDGPKWTSNYPGCPKTKEGMICFDTPFHFPLQLQDQLGATATSLHEELAEERAFNDQKKWETYAQLLRLSFWEHKIDQRYTDRGRVKAFVTKKLNVLSEILSLETDRIRKLRRLLKRLKNGTRSDLTAWR